MNNARMVVGILVFFLLLFVGCVGDKKTSDSSSDFSALGNPPTLPPTICITEIKDKATGELLFKQTKYLLGLSSRERIDYMDEKVAEDELFRRMAFALGKEEGYETIYHYIENETHEGYVIYFPITDYVKGYRKIVGDELYEKYLGNCKWIVEEMVATKEEVKKRAEEFEKKLQDSSGEENEKKSYEEMDNEEREFALKYEKKETCSPAQFGEEMFVITENVCPYEEIDKKLGEMYKEYSSMQGNISTEE